MIKKKIRYNVIFAEPENVQVIIKEALVTKTLQINYFWTVIDSGIKLSNIEDLIPANGSANILIIRESAVTLTGVECSADLMTVFPDCQMTKHSMIELKTVEALLSFASALQNMSNSPLIVSNATCQPLQPWLGGAAASALMKQQRQPLSAQINWLPRDYFLESVATFHDEIAGPIKFVNSGRFQVENMSLIRTFSYRNRLLLFPNTFIDFKNRTLRVCAGSSRPYTEYSNGTFGTPYGITVDLVKYFATHLNFTYTIFAPPDNQFGAPVPGSPYFTGCIGMVQKGEADFANPFAITTIRNTVIDYSEDYMFSFNSILVQRPPVESKLWNVFSPLAWDSWALILGMFFIVPLFIYIFAYLSPFSAWNLKLPYAFADEIWLKEYIWSVIGSFMQQGQDFYPFAMSPRTVLAFWWMLTVIIFASYTGDLTSKLAVTVAKYPIQSLDDLLSKPHYKAMIPYGTNFYAATLAATEGPLVKLRQQMVAVASLELCVSNLVTMPDPYLTCITDLSISLYYASTLCKHIYNAENNFNPYYLALAFPKDAYYLPAFDFLIQRGKANGVIGMIIDKYIPRTSDCGTVVTAASEAAAIPLEGVGGAYILSMALYICGGFILCIELLWVFVLKKKPMKFPGY